jgi:DNA polymerase-3 subunit alpha
MSKKFKLNWDEEMLINLVKITDQGQLEKKLQETSPDDLKQFTQQTYSPFKKQFIANHKAEFPGKDLRFSLSDYVERLEYELKVIKEMGFNSYFLIVSDYVRWAKTNQISVGPGRGSGAGSVLARFVEITDVDPLPFDLLFERFLNPSRISMPDFDIDFEDTLRGKVIEYVTEKYGIDKVCSIGTFMKMASKAAFKDAARTLGLPFEKSNYVSNLLPDKMGLLEIVNGTPDGENEELKNLYETDDKIKNAIEYGDALTGNMRQLGVHACGIIIAPEQVIQYTPTQYNKENDHTIVSQYDGPTLEYIGLLKMDFLGLRNLSIIKNCIKIFKARNEKTGEPLPEMFQQFLDTMSFDPPLDDEYTYEKVFKQGDTTGIFQFESAGMRRFLIQLEPTKIDNIVAMAALYRPGPMEFIPAYIERRHGREEIEYLYPDLREELTRKYGAEVAEEERRKLIEDLDPIMKDTYGIAVYQEQLMFLVQAMAGFSLGEADLLRRGVGKKKKEIIEQLKKEFIEKGAEFRGYKPETTKQIYEKMIEPAASYSFNKSHAVCYAFIAYQTAYLKAHYPLEFYAALIRSVEEDTDTQSFYISEIQYHGIAVLAPDVNVSFNHVAAIDEAIRIGFMSIKGVGFDTGEFIQQERKKS